VGRMGGVLAMLSTVLLGSMQPVEGSGHGIAGASFQRGLIMKSSGLAAVPKVGKLPSRRRDDEEALGLLSSPRGFRKMGLLPLRSRLGNTFILTYVLSLSMVRDCYHNLRGV
jgi:hypothetical protein